MDETPKPKRWYHGCIATPTWDDPNLELPISVKVCPGCGTRQP